MGPKDRTVRKLMEKRERVDHVIAAARAAFAQMDS